MGTVLKYVGTFIYCTLIWPTVFTLASILLPQLRLEIQMLPFALVMGIIVGGIFGTLFALILHKTGHDEPFLLTNTFMTGFVIAYTTHPLIPKILL